MMPHQTWFHTFCLLCLATVSVCHAQTSSPARFVGVSLAGAEFGTDSADFSNKRSGAAGVEFVFSNAATIGYFSRAGVRLFRIPFRWERVQPALGKHLDRSHIDALRRVCRLARKHRCQVLLDVHNYARYRIVIDGSPKTCIIDEHIDGQIHVSRDHFADLWRRLAIEFRNEPSVIGYGLMNEPHDIGGADWKQISQHAVDAIRTVDQKTRIFVAGDQWSSAETFADVNGRAAWIRDPTNKTVYEAHCYFDRDSSGKYKLSFEDELTRDSKLLDRGIDRVQPFLNWCRENRVKGFIGEYGTPADPEWKDVTTRFLKICDANDVQVCYWAAGEWWGEYPLSVQPRKNSRLPAPQLNWLLHSN